MILYTSLLKIAVACNIRDHFREKVIDAYFLYAVGLETFNNDNTRELQSVDNMINLLIGDDCEEFFAYKDFYPEEKRQ